MAGKNPKVDEEFIAKLERARLTRLELLKRGGITALVLGGTPALLAACGGEEEEAAPPSAEPAPAPAEPAAPPPPAEPQVPPASGTIDYFSWEGYDIPGPMEQWKKENGVVLKATYIATHDDIQAKLKGGGGKGIDLTTYYQGYKPLYKELAIITPLDESKIPNLKNLAPFFASDVGNFWVDPDGTRTGVPWTWGSLSITYDSAAIKEPPGSYEDLLDPKYKGKVAITDDPVGAFTQAAHVLGVDVSKMTEEDLENVKGYLSRIIAQTKGVSASYGDMSTRLVSGDAVITFTGWAALNKFAADAGKNTVKTVIPKEGGMSFCDAWAIPPGADNVDTIHAWINETLEPEVAADIADFLVAGTTVADAVPLLDPAISALYGYADLEATLQKAPFYNNPPVQSDQYVTIDKVIAAWQELKAAA